MSKETRHRRVRAKVRGTKDKPRFSVFRSNKHIFLQLIDDKSRKTLVSESDLKLKKESNKNRNCQRSWKKIGGIGKIKKN